MRGRPFSLASWAKSSALEAGRATRQILALARSQKRTLGLSSFIGCHLYGKEGMVVVWRPVDLPAPAVDEALGAGTAQAPGGDAHLAVPAAGSLGKEALVVAEDLPALAVV